MSGLPEETIKSALAQLDARRVLEYLDYRTDTIQEGPKGLRCFCPIHKEQAFRSFSLDLGKGLGRCSYTPCPGHRPVNLLELVALVRNIPVEAALAELAQRFSLQVTLPGQAALPDTPLETARKALAAGQADTAYEAFHRVLTGDPDNEEAMRGLVQVCRGRDAQDEAADLLKRIAALHLTAGRSAESAEAYEEYLKARPDDVEARLRYAECLHRLSRPDDVVAEMLRIGALFEAQKDSDRALEIYRRIQAFQPGSEEAAQAIEQLLLRAGRASEAVAHILEKAARLAERNEPLEVLVCYRQVLDLDPLRDDVRRKFLEGVLHNPDLAESILPECLTVLDGLVDSSEADLLEALEGLNQRFVGNLALQERLFRAYDAAGRVSDADELAFDLANYYLESGTFALARQWVDPLVKRGGAGLATALSLKAQICRAMGNDAEALATLIEAIDFQERNGRFDEALPFYGLALELDPGNLQLISRRLRAFTELRRDEEVAEMLSDVLGQLQTTGDSERALEIVDELLRLADAGRLPASAALTLVTARAERLRVLDRTAEARDAFLRAADMMREQDNSQGAIAIFETLLKQDSHDLEAMERLADSRLAIGEHDDAVAAYRALADLYGEQGSLDAQLDQLLKIARITPDDVDVLKRILAMYDQMGNTRDARELRGRLAVLHCEREEYGQALDICRAVLRTDPNDLPALEMCVRVYDATGERDSLRREALRLLDLHQATGSLEDVGRVMALLDANFPDDPEVLSLRIRALCAQGSGAEALPLVERVLETNQKAGRDTLSLDLLRRVVASSPDLLDAGLLRRWVELCCRTETIEENWVETEQMLGMLRQWLEPADLVDHLRLLIETAPGFAPPRTQTISLLEAAGERPKAAAALRDWARFCISQGDTAQAARHYQRAVDMQGDNLELLSEVLDFRSAEGIAAGSGDLALRLADLLETAGLVALAVSMLETGLRLEPRREDLRERALALDEIIASPDFLRRRYEEISTARSGAGDFASARAVLVEAVQRFPMEVNLRLTLADLYGQMELAEERTAELANIAEIQAEMGDPAAAEETIAQVLAEAPDNLNAQAIQAEIHAKMGLEKRALTEFRSLSKRVAVAPPRPAAPAEGDGREEAAPQESFEMLPLNTSYSFDHFVVGTRNNFAHATARAIAANPGGDYNPLFLHGDVGLGKTHLLQAIALELKNSHPELHILYTSTEEFTNALIEAIQANTIRRFRALFKSPDVLLIDDVHGLAEKERAQEEFFQIFNALYQANRQIVMTSDRPPKEIAHLERRLRSRFAAGIIVDIQSPDLETRMAILRCETAEQGVAVPDELLLRIAQRISSNVRELKSTLRQLVARIRIGGEPPTESLVEQILAETIGGGAD